MRVLLLSNQSMSADMIGNPIMLRIRDALLCDDRIFHVEMFRCKHPLAALSRLRATAQSADIIHLHFGGLYALVVWFCLLGINRKKLISFHGTDIHAKAIRTTRSWHRRVKIRLNQWASFACLLLYDKCGFVSHELVHYIPSFLQKVLSRKFFLQPLGVDYNLFTLSDSSEAQEQLGLEKGRYALFSDVRNSPIKRKDLATAIMKLLPDFHLLVMCQVHPTQVPTYVNACDFVLLTSDEEGSPNIIREGLSLNKRVFSVDVGDAVQQLTGLENSAIISRSPEQAAATIRVMMERPYVDNTREKLCARLNFAVCHRPIVDLYSTLVHRSEENLTSEQKFK